MTSLSPEEVPDRNPSKGRATFTATDRDAALRAVAALPSGSRILLVGASDTGKTTFAREALNFLADASAIPAALIDSDIGQSEIGPPGTIGLAAVAPGQDGMPLASLHSLPLIDAAFVGATAPPGHLLEMVAGLVRLVRVAERRLEGAGRIIIDTPGFIAGPAARALVRAIVASVEPALILGFARASELDPLLAQFRHLAPPPVIAVVRAGREVGRKTAAVRSARRVARFAHYLAGASPLTLPWSQIDIVNTPLGSGSPLAPHLVKFIGNAVGSQCLYAEKAVDGAIYALLAGPVKKPTGATLLEEQFKTRHISLVPVANFNGLLCGLLNSHGEFVHIGLIDTVDPVRGSFTVLTPVRRPEAIRQVILGAVSVRPDGREIGHIRPGSV